MPRTHWKTNQINPNSLQSPLQAHLVPFSVFFVSFCALAIFFASSRSPRVFLALSSRYPRALALSSRCPRVFFGGFGGVFWAIFCFFLVFAVLGVFGSAIQNNVEFSFFVARRPSDLVGLVRILRANAPSVNLSKNSAVSSARIEEIGENHLKIGYK